MSYEDRKIILEACRYVDEVFPEEDWQQKLDDAKRLGVSVFVMGDDWAGKFDFMEAACKVVYLPRTEGVSTTQIKASVRTTPSQPFIQTPHHFI
jgi:glycerol-3-phosphate cytidylyltransferase